MSLHTALRYANAGVGPPCESHWEVGRCKRLPKSRPSIAPKQEGVAHNPADRRRHTVAPVLERARAEIEGLRMTPVTSHTVPSPTVKALDAHPPGHPQYLSQSVKRRRAATVPTPTPSAPIPIPNPSSQRPAQQVRPIHPLFRTTDPFDSARERLAPRQSKASVSASPKDLLVASDCIVLRNDSLSAPRRDSGQATLAVRKRDGSRSLQNRCSSAKFGSPGSVGSGRGSSLVDEVISGLQDASLSSIDDDLEGDGDDEDDEGEVEGGEVKEDVDEVGGFW